MIDHEATQELASPSETGEPAVAPESGTPPVEAPLPVAGPAAPARRNIWPILIGALLLVVASSAITYLVATDSDTGAGVVAGSEANTDEDASSGSGAPPVVVPADEPIATAAAIILPSVVQIQSAGGVGSGVIYDAEGLILTAAHVVAGQDTVTVRFEDGEEVEGTVLGGTPDADVAVVQVERSGLPAAELALGETPVVGQIAIAVGSPWGLQGTVTSGVISAVDQPIDGETGPRAMLQTDAAINPGNSGGALVDRDGRVLGINVSIFSLSGANDGVGFAVPIDVANDIAERVVSGESLGNALLGVTGSNAESGRAGALIAEVSRGSAADVAGVEVGDLVIEIDGASVQGIADLAAQVRSHRPGTTVDIVVVRDGQELTLAATLGERQADQG